MHLLKPMIDGKALQLMYECKAGKHMKPLIEEVLKFQILNMDAGVAEVEAHMLANKELFMSKYA